jgi:hypothetical protein
MAEWEILWKYIDSLQKRMRLAEYAANLACAAYSNP